MKLRRCTMLETLPLQAACLPHDDAYTGFDETVWYIVEDAQGPAAFGAVSPLADYPGWWYLARAGVLPRARGQNLQVRLIRARVAAAKRLGATTVITDCTSSNPASANNLIRCGFRLYAPVRPWALPNSIYWRRRL